MKDKMLKIIEASLKNKMNLEELIYKDKRKYTTNKKYIDLHIVDYCNMNCFQCASSCRQQSLDSYMSIDYIEKFIEESMALDYKWEWIKLYGGEPTLHPQFFEILDLLRGYNKKETGFKLEIMSNGTGKKVQSILERVPNDVAICNSGKKDLRKKLLRHESYNIAPRDLPGYDNADFTKGCWRLEVCGAAYTTRGWFPCCPGGDIDRVFDLGLGVATLEEFIEYDEDKQLKKLCSYCGCFQEPQLILMNDTMSQTWRKGYKEYDDKK